MKSCSPRRLAALALVLAAALPAFGCSDNSTQPKETKPRYPEATTQDIVISNLLLSFQDRDIEQYEKLLHADYVWYNQARDVVYGLPEFYTRDEDIQQTRNMFLAAKHTHPNSTLWLDRLKLTLTSGSWQQVYEFNGVACTDCWETTREYYVELVLTGGTMTFIANDLVKFTLGGAEVDGTKVYRICRCDDISRP